MLLALRKRASYQSPEAIDLVSLVARIGGGDHDALACFYDATSRKVFSSALRITANTADAEEITCDVYLRVWRIAKHFDPGRGSPMQWLGIMARNRALDSWRRRRARPTSEYLEELDQRQFAAEDPLPEETAHQLQIASLLEGELCKLPVLQRRVVQLAFFDGLTHTEIAECADLPLGSVKSLIARALMKLRAALLTKETVQAYTDSHPGITPRERAAVRRRRKRRDVVCDNTASAAGAAVGVGTAFP
jgi:RNA polymerase sigma-70 factor, ECF subfamily